MEYIFTTNPKLKKLKDNAVHMIQDKINRLSYDSNEILELADIRNRMINMLENPSWNPPESSHATVVNVMDYIPRIDEYPEQISVSDTHPPKSIIIDFQIDDGEIIRRKGLWMSHPVRKGDLFYFIMNGDYSDFYFVHHKEHRDVYQLALSNIPDEYLEYVEE